MLTARRLPWVTPLVGLSALALPALVAASCSEQPGCLDGDDGQCIPESACRGLRYECAAGSIRLSLVEAVGQRPEGLKALAAPGDIRLENDRLVAVLDGLGDGHYLAPSGGSLLDLSSLEPGSHDQLPVMFQAVGILPHDAARYQHVELIDRSPELIAVVFRGTLDGRPEIEIVTRYELRPCEPGLRLRSELYHGGVEPLTVFLSDAFFWGDRGAAPFLPVPGGGFRHPELDFEELDDAFRTAPFLAALPQARGGSAYGVVGCAAGGLSGFHTETISAAGSERRVLLPGDSVAFERFVVAAPGASGLGELGLRVSEARAMLFGDRWTTLRGRLVDELGQPLAADERWLRLLFYEPSSSSDPDAEATRTPWTAVVPGADGQYQVTLPARRRYRVEAHRFGRPLWHEEFNAGDLESTLPDWTVPRPALLEVRVRDAGGQPLVSELVLVPAPPTRPADVAGSLHGLFAEPHCAPYLGSPHAGSPACNRVLVGQTGVARFEAPEGAFYVYATRGPFWSLARAAVMLRPGATESIELELEPLSLLPANTLSADFHVHSGRSFDSAFPEADRALSFVAAGVDVIVATDHEVVTSYDQALGELDLQDRVRVISGLETTGHILFLRPPGSDVPKVIGHFNFWPLDYDPALPRDGAPDDERLEPGALFDRLRAAMPERGVIQLNHPFHDDAFGRDQGYLTAIGYRAGADVPAAADGTAAGQLRRRPGGGHSNLDFDVQEVMNGHSLRGYLQYRAGWFGFLNQGIVRAGTANSDSHSLAVEVLGYPRNLVFDAGPLAELDRTHFNQQVRLGRMAGTNGPVLTACWASEPSAPGCAWPSLEALPDTPAAELRVRLVAAPWIPVEELRFIVNGVLAERAEVELRPSSPFGSAGTLRYEAAIGVRQLLTAAASDRDAWIVVEAGLPLPGAGEPDEPGRAEETDARHSLDVVAPGTWPAAFVNPFLIDRTGNGFDAPPGQPR